MNANTIKKLLIPVTAMLIMALIISPGCQNEETPPPATPATNELPSTMVPDIPLDLYLYGKQDEPTVLPAGMINASRDISIETLSVWGSPAEDDFALGMGITFTRSEDAAKVYEEITFKEGWKKLSGKTIYLVDGSGPAAKAMKTAIANGDFKPYDDQDALQAAATLPEEDRDRQIAVVTAKPTKNLIAFLTRDSSSDTKNMINLIQGVANLKIVAAGLYSREQADIAELARKMSNDGDFSSLDIGMVIYLESGVPGFIVEPAVKKLLTDQGFKEVNDGELTLYRGYLDKDKEEGIPVLIRIEGNRIFAAVSGRETYAGTLISNVRLD